MNQSYIYESSKNKELQSEEGIILLPDIYCQTDYSKRTAEEFAAAFNRPVFLLDYFYPATKQANILSESDRDIVHGLMNNFKGDDFASFFEGALSEIKEFYPQLKTFSVIGFCFGGRLAYIAGGSPSVSRVVSFYGGGANTPNYIEGESPIEYFIDKKGQNISTISFFGINDPSISEEDRNNIKELFANAGADFHFYEYDAGHAYFQEGRKNFNEAASKASWDVLNKIFHDK